MNWLNPLALLLLAALPVLLWLALRRQQPAAMQVGSLFIWRRVAQAAAAATQRKRRVEPLLWLLLAACALAAVGAARPALAPGAGGGEVAVFIERLAEAGPEPDIAGVISRAREAAPDATIRIWFAGEGIELGTVERLNPGPVHAELAQFFTATRDTPRMMFLCEPETGAASNGLVLPRVTAPRDGVIFDVRSEDREVLVRMTRGEGPKVEGAALAAVETQGREYVRTYTATAETLRFTNALQAVTLRREALRVGVGVDWSGPRPKALLEALKPGGDSPQVWLGGSESTPAVRINQGKAVVPSAAEVTFDSQHALFRELPVSSLDLIKGGRLIERTPGSRPLASVAIAGNVAGDLVTLSADGKVLSFANDPFSESSVTAAALLLDNAIGVVTGTRPSERPSYTLAEGTLPTRRQAMAEPFEPRGEIGAGRHAPEPREYAPWLLALAGLCGLAAAGLALKRR